MDNAAGGDCSFDALARSIVGRDASEQKVVTVGRVLRKLHAEACRINHAVLLSSGFEDKELNAQSQGTKGVYANSVWPYRKYFCYF